MVEGVAGDAAGGAACADLDSEVLVGWLRTSPPGPGVIGVLAGVDPGLLSHSQQVDLLVVFEQVAAWVAAGQQRVLAVLAAGPDGPASPSVDDEAVLGGGDDWVREEVAAALRLSPVTADRRLQVARALDGRLGDTWSALTEGSINYVQAAAIVAALDELDDRTAAAVQARVLGRASGQSLAELRRCLRRAVLAADPVSAGERHEQARVERRVELWPARDGMAELHAVLSAEEAATVWTAVDALAHQPTDPDRQHHNPDGIDARRADALVGLATAVLARPELPSRHGARPHIQVTVAATTLLGVDDVAGYGPVTAEVARRVAADGIWRRLLTDPVTGRLVDYGRTVYRPPADLARFVIARDQRCSFPHCGQPAVRCDLDHVIRYPDGPTNADNLAALCRRHHRAKHEGGWKLAAADGGHDWTSPAGRSYHVQVPSVLPDP